MRICRSKQLGTKESLEDLIVLIRVWCGRLPNLAIIVIGPVRLEACAARLVGGVVTGEALLGENVVLVLEI